MKPFSNKWNSSNLYAALTSCVARHRNERIGEIIDSLALALLQHADTRLWVEDRLIARRGPEAVMRDYDPRHAPGPLRRSVLPKAGGKLREIWIPSDYDMCQGLFHLFAILRPWVEMQGHNDTHGFRLGRGIGSAIGSLLEITAGSEECHLIKVDIADCFSTLPTWDVENIGLPSATATYLALLSRRYASQANIRQGRGMPPGHPVSPAYMNIRVDSMLHSLRAEYAGVAAILSYADDGLLVTRGPDIAMGVLARFEQLLAHNGMTLNAGKTVHTQIRAGAELTYLGHVLRWRANRQTPRISPKPSAYARLASKLASSIDEEHCHQIYRSWRQTYKHVNDPNFHSHAEYVFNTTRRRRIQPIRTLLTGPSNGVIFE